MTGAGEDAMLSMYDKDKDLLSISSDTEENWIMKRYLGKVRKSEDDRTGQIDVSPLKESLIVWRGLPPLSIGLGINRWFQESKEVRHKITNKEVNLEEKMECLLLPDVKVDVQEWL